MPFVRRLVDYQSAEALPRLSGRHGKTRADAIGVASRSIWLNAETTLGASYERSFMTRPARILQPEFTYHLTMRCNNRRFNLNRKACRQVLIYAIERAQSKYPFTLDALCIMSNHMHYWLEPEVPEDLPRIMHWLNWYSAMCFNRMLNRTGHFWEQRYHSSGFARDDHERALNTPRYIHANPKAAGMTKGFCYCYRNYGT